MNKQNIENIENIENYKIAGQIHKEVYSYIQDYLIPGIKLIDICHLIENKIQVLSEKYTELHGLPKQFNNSIAFPTGISINNVAAHYTPYFNETTILKDSDVCKIDYGVHINGCIIDSAFTINIDKTFDKLLEASNNAVNAIIKNIGIDTKFKELSELSQEIVCSYEIEIDKKNIGLKPIDNVCGHNILPWKIHGGKLLYGIPKTDDNQIVEENDVIAVEIFVTTGDGTTILDTNTDNYSHYMLKPMDTKTKIPIFQTKRTNELVSIIKNNFSTLPFCPRFVNYFNNSKKNINYNYSLTELFNYGVLNSYPPLIETNSNAYISQFEHTIFIGNNKMILSK